MSVDQKNDENYLILSPKNMNIFSYLNEYKELIERKKARDWFAVGILFNLLIAKYGLRVKLSKHQERYLRDVRESVEINFGRGSKEESKLIRFQLVERLAEAIGSKLENLKQTKLNSIIEDAERLSGAALKKRDREMLAGAKMNHRQRSTTEAALSYAEHLGSSEKEYRRTKKDRLRLEGRAAQYWGHDVNLVPALESFLCGMLQFSEEEAIKVINFVLDEILPARKSYTPALALGQARQVILQSVLRSKESFSEDEILEKLETEFPSFVPSFAAKASEIESDSVEDFFGSPIGLSSQDSPAQ